MRQKSRSVGMLAFLLVLATLGLATLPQDTISTLNSTALAQGRDRGEDGTGAVFAMTNETARNQIVIYRRANDGTLTMLRSVRTRGLGIGVDTDTQGPLRLSPDNRFLYAVNPGSDNISVFEVNGTRLRFL